jgi:tRNA pseudouridine38-40 synthase
MRNIVLSLAYDGTNYHGWQCQPNALTVQEVLNNALGRILNHPVTIYAGGRTDAGVHAMGQIINFHTEKVIALRTLAKGLNSILPRDIRVNNAREEEISFHARYSAKSKTYIYCILNTPYNSPFLERYAWHIHYTLNVSAMDDAAKVIIGEHDFSAFKKKNEAYKSTIREIFRAGVKIKGDLIYFIIEARGFLRYMVRNIMGSIVLVGSGKITAEEFIKILESKDREKAGPTAPARGLFLRKIKY